MPDSAILNSNRVGALPISIFSSNHRLSLEGSGEFFPRPTYTETFASGPATEGGPLARSKADNVVTSGQLMVMGSTRASLLANVATFEQKLEECRRYGGALTYTPESGVSITYDIESARVVSMDHSTVRLAGGNVPVVFEMTFLPYGRLAPVTLISNEPHGGLIAEVEVPAFGGSIDALGTLTVQDTSAQARLFFEGGLESRYYNPATAWPLLIDSADMTSLQSAVTDTSIGSSYLGSTLRQTLSATPNTPEGIGYYQSSWVGRFRVKARLWAQGTAGNTAAQVRWSVRGGSASVGPWVPIPTTNWRELDLGIVAFPPALSGTHSARVDIYAKSLSASTIIDLDYVKMIPAERYWRASGGVGAVSAIRSNRFIRVRHDALETETATGTWQQHPNAIGSYLLIPPSGGRIVVHANRNDLTDPGTAGQATVVTDDVEVDLVVTPRVALLGA